MCGFSGITKLSLPYGKIQFDFLVNSKFTLGRVDFHVKEIKIMSKK